MQGQQLCVSAVSTLITLTFKFTILFMPFKSYTLDIHKQITEMADKMLQCLWLCFCATGPNWDTGCSQASTPNHPWNLSWLNRWWKKNTGYWTGYVQLLTRVCNSLAPSHLYENKFFSFLSFLHEITSIFEHHFYECTFLNIQFGPDKKQNKKT